MSFLQSKITNKFLKDLLKVAQKDLCKNEIPSDLNIDDIWNNVIGEKLASVTRVKSFYDGVLIIWVTSAPLNQLLSTTEKPKILARLKKDFPFLKIKNLIFRSG